MWDVRIGIISTRNAPGTIAFIAISTASAVARRNRSSLLVIFKPYVISMTSATIALATEVEKSEIQQNKL